MAQACRRFLIAANRTDTTPDLLSTVRRYAQQRPTTFTLLIPLAPNADHADWTLEVALPLLERAARGPVAGLAATCDDPVQAIRDALERERYDRIIISTLPR